MIQIIIIIAEKQIIIIISLKESNLFPAKPIIENKSHSTNINTIIAIIPLPAVLVFIFYMKINKD